MSLRDTLNKNADEQRRKEEFEAKKPNMIEERQALANKLCDQVKDWLFEYERDGLAKVETAPVQVDEFQFATYLSTGLNMDFGEKRITLQPVGRSLAGSIFEIRSAGNGGKSRFSIIANNDEVYLLDRESPNNSPIGGVRKEQKDWSKENLETVIDELLKARR